MSSNDQLSSDDDDDDDDDQDDDDQEEEESHVSTAADHDLESAEGTVMKIDDTILWLAIERDDAEIVRTALQNGANANAVRNDWSPLMKACHRGYDQIVGILLNAGADARCRDSHGLSAITMACWNGHLSIVELLISHDNGLLEMTTNDGWTPFLHAVHRQHSDIVRILLDSGADPHHVNLHSQTALIYACRFDNLEIVRLLLDAGVDVEARDKDQRTALYYAASWGRIEIMRGLILQHNADMFAVDKEGRTPFDIACNSRNVDAVDPLLEIYGRKSTQDHGRFALHERLKVVVYSFAEDKKFHPPQNPLRIILPLGKLTLKHFRTLLHTLDPELIRNRDDTGKSPIHIACQTNAPVEVLALILELDSTTLHIADSTGALPIHLLCGTTATTEYASVQYLVEQGGVGTLAARNQQGASPLHVLCGSTNPPLRAVQYLMQSFPGSVTLRTNAGDYPFMIAAAAASSLASLSVIYELVRATPGLVVPR